MTPDSVFEQMHGSEDEDKGKVGLLCVTPMATRPSNSLCKIAVKGESGIPKRHRIEHCSLVDKALERMSDLGISPSFLVGHVGGATHSKMSFLRRNLESANLL